MFKKEKKRLNECQETGTCRVTTILPGDNSFKVHKIDSCFQAALCHYTAEVLARRYSLGAVQVSLYGPLSGRGRYHNVPITALNEGFYIMLRPLKP